MSLDEIKQIHDIHKAAAGNANPLNWMITIRCPAGLALNDGKKWLSRTIGKIGQALKRSRYKHIGLTVFERRRSVGELHAHHLISLDASAKTIVDRFADGDTIRIDRCHSNTLGYVTKQRVKLPPEYERATKLRKRQAGDYIPGTRLSVTKQLISLVPNYTRARRKLTPQFKMLNRMTEVASPQR